MARNVEIKARVDDAPALFAHAKAIAEHGPVVIAQDDTFFQCASGRLKLRILSESEGQLIFYQRNDSMQPKESNYTIVPTSTPSLLLKTLASALGVRGRVEKKRILFLVGNTRIHLDEVAGLGDFVELEVVLREGETVEHGIATARDIMQRLEIDEQRLVDRAYIDLFATKA